jgi:hypothetical protein
MFKFLKSDETRSQELYNELQTLDAEKPIIEEEKKKLDPLIWDAFREFTKQKAVGNIQEAITANARREELLYQKFSLSESLYRKRSEVENKLRQITLPYISSCTSGLTGLVKQLLTKRRFEIKEKGTESSKGGPFYLVSHNWESISGVTDRLTKAADEIRSSDLLPLSRIRQIYETALKNVPDNFDDLTDEASGGETMLTAFREGSGVGLVTIDQDFSRMSMAEAQILGDMGRLKQGLQSLKKFFKNATA